MEEPRELETSDSQTLQCEQCGANLDINTRKGIYVIVEGDKNRTMHVYLACKGKCDKTLQAKYGWGGWEDLADLCVPQIWLSRFVAVMNGLALRGDTYEAEAYKKLRGIFVATFLYVRRELTEEDISRFQTHQDTMGL